MINIEEERKAFEIEWIKLGGDFKSFSIIDNMYVLIPSMASADDVIKEFAERAVNSAFALWLIQSRQKQVVIDDLNIQLKDAKATPEGFVLVPKDELTTTYHWGDAEYVVNYVSEYEMELEKGEIAELEKWEQTKSTKAFFANIYSDEDNFEIVEFDSIEATQLAIKENKALIEAQEQSHD